VAAGLALSMAYLALSQAAKWKVEHDAGRALASRGLEDAPRFSVPMPFNILLWRVVAMTPQGFVEGERSLVADRAPMMFREYDSDARALKDVRGYAAVRRLDWFNRGFMKAQERDGQLVLSDLRMGAEPDYTFRFAVAQRDGAGWREIPPRQMRWPWEATRRLDAMWRRIWLTPRTSHSAPAPPVEAGRAAER
jgi:inner membrane protein